MFSNIVLSYKKRKVMFFDYKNEQTNASSVD